MREANPYSVLRTPYSVIRAPSPESPLPTPYARMHYLPDSERTRRLTTEELRASFVVRDLFQAGALTLRFIDLDRVVLGGAVPAEAPLRLDAPEALAAA